MGSKFVHVGPQLYIANIAEERHLNMSASYSRNKGYLTRQLTNVQVAIDVSAHFDNTCFVYFD
jgi:DNA-directed RNA polymerase alpha subunit